MLRRGDESGGLAGPPDGRVVGASNSGLGVVDLSSVGEGRLASTPGTYEQDAGTSFASPAVAGTAALILQVRPHATAAQVESVLTSSAVPTSCAHAGELFSEQPCRSRGRLTSWFGHGRLDALAAVRAAARLPR